MKPDVSIIIVSWNTKEMLKNCLTTVFIQQGCDFEVFVVDNNSLDGTQEMVRGEFPQVKMIMNTKNRGFAAANNQALRIAQGNSILLLNSDTEFLEANCLQLLLQEQRQSGAGIIGPNLMYPNKTSQPSVRNFPTFVSQLLILLKLHIILPRLKVLRTYFASSFDYTKDQQVNQVSGACFLIQRQCFDKVGLLDDRFWIWFEEVDYCKRAVLAGFTVWYFSKPQILHFGGMSFSKVMPRDRQKVFNESLLLYAKKYFSHTQYAILRFCAPIAYLFSLATPRHIRQHSYSHGRKEKE